MECPLCHKEVADVKAVRCDEPYTAKQVFEGLEAWGAIQAAKETLCIDETWVHFRFVDNGEERLVEMKPFSLEYVEEQRAYHAEHPQACQHEGCDKPGNPGYFEPYDEEPIGWACEDHAREEGFCPGCMHFCAGQEGFDFSPLGLCDNCTDELKYELGEYDDDDWDEWDDPDWPEAE